MSGNGDDDKLEAGKSFPLDLAAKLSTMKTIDGKAPLLIPGKGMRLLSQAPSGMGQSSSVPTIIATNIVPAGAVIKPDDLISKQIMGIIRQSLPQVSGNITIQRQAQIATLPVGQSNTGTTYHVPRGPAVVANLSAPRSSNIGATIRGPMVVTATAQGQGFVRPPRAPSPAQNTAWLTANASNGSQIKGTPTVLSTPIRGTSLGGKPQLIARPQVVTTIRPTAILHSAIIGQGQIHPFKPGQGAPGIQTLNTAGTLSQVVPNRTQTLVYSTGTNAHFAGSPRLTVASTVQGQRQVTAPRPLGQVTTRLAMPVNVTQNTTRLMAPQGTVLASLGARISTVQAPTPTRIVSAPQTLGRLTVTVANTNTSNILTQIRSSMSHSLVVPAAQTRTTIQTQGAKVIAPNQGTAIHLTQIPATLKSTSNIVSTASRTINTQAGTIVTQRQGALTLPIAKVYPQQGDGQQVTTPTNVYIQAPVTSVPRRPSPGPINQSTNSIPTTTVATYSLASGTYFYDPSGGNYSVARQFGQQPTAFAISQTSNQQQQQQRPNTIGTQVHGIVANQSMRFNPIMLVEPSRTQQQQPFSQESSQDNLQSVQTPTKMTSSPRPSILRKRDHEGSPLKAAKNLIPALTSLPAQSPVSPPSRPDSRNNGHSSGGSTTISATSSPGLADNNDDSMPHVPMNIKEEEENRPPLEMSPRKKPRKQNLTGNDLDENHDDMQFISERDIKKEQQQHHHHNDDSDGIHSDGPQDGAPESRRVSTIRKPATASLLNSYRQTWKTTHNHYLRYSDVQPKDERRATVIDLANQNRVLDKVNGWKIHHLSTQMEDLADQEESVHNQLTELLKYTESKEKNNSDVNRINELIKGNLQRIKIINDGMIEAKSQIMKIFEHKVHVTDIISRCASKRNYKKREKS